MLVEGFSIPAPCHAQEPVLLKRVLTKVKKSESLKVVHTYYKACVPNQSSQLLPLCVCVGGESVVELVHLLILPQESLKNVFLLYLHM